MRRASRLALLLLGLTTAVRPLSGQLTISARAADMSIGGSLHTQYAASSLSGQNGAVDDVFIRRARVQFDLRVGALEARVEPDFGGGGAGVGPADLWARLNFARQFKLSVGQFKRAFSWFELASDTDLPDIERDARIEGENDCPGVGGSCSFSRLAEKLQFDDRDIGMRVEGDLGTRFQYLGTLTNGQGRNQADINDPKSTSLRLTFAATPSVRLSAFGAVHDYADTTSADPTGPDFYAEGGGVDLEVGTWRKGFHLIAGAIGGENWLAGPDADFWAAEALGTYYIPLPEGGTLAGIEPLLRLDRTWVDNARGAAGQLHTLVVTPGVSLYVTGKNWLDFNLDWYDPDPGDSEWSFKTQFFFYY